MLSFPSSGAMDATASSGGPSTILPEIVTGSPDRIAKHVGELLTKATEFTNLMTEFTKAAEQLEKAWSDEDSESALRKISESIAALTKIIGVVEKGAELLGISGTLVRTAQEAYRSVVGAVNPTVASLMSNPWTYDAAVALSTATSASLRRFVEAVGAVLEALGAVDLAHQISQLRAITGAIDELLDGAARGSPRRWRALPRSDSSTEDSEQEEPREHRARPGRAARAGAKADRAGAPDPAQRRSDGGRGALAR